MFKIGRLDYHDNTAKISGLPLSNANLKQIKSFDSQIIQKGLKNLDNPVLRGSFILVLAEQDMDFLDTIAKQAFREVMQIETAKKANLFIKV